ncbi:alpha/beta hydrolase [Lysobacter pythonis]|uniref:Alpha/beta hydrolase n=1 Tax=Solilutibacter pythonis TaxID=2483112 RepID=A0A3M2HVN6_9GAMM|nr:CocE/NonD family hydrolase [Lysobacter pythonis]RMH93796.1 alpha/beta hydrolase [Lysobacter pythonis]
MNPPAFPTQDTPLTLPGPTGPLETVVELPDAGGTPQPVVAIVCHPLPTEGGTMNNKVVTMTARALRELGVTTVRFNFRGTGHSAGEFDEGVGEQADLRAVAAWVRAERPEALLWLAGFSFGAFVSIRASATLEPAALISLAPPAGRWDFDDAAPPMPWLVVQGEEDEIVDPNAVYHWLERLDAPRLTLVKMPGCSHFFHGKLVDLRGVVKNTARHWLPNPPRETTPPPSAEPAE